MPPSSQSSFIPKKSIKRIERVRSSRRVNILTYIAYSVFFGVILVSVATFLYLKFLENKLGETLAELDSQRSAFSGGSIEQVKEMERRLRMAEYFFAQHTSTNLIFNELERLAVRDISFASFNLDRVTQDMFEVSITGQTFKFDSVAFQTDLFADSELFGKAQIAEITKEAQVEQTDENGGATDSTLPVNFVAKMNFSVNELAFDASAYTVAPVVTAPAFVPEPAATSSDATSVQVEDDVATP